MLRRAKSLRVAQRGLGLVELLVGLAVGLFVVAGGLVLFAGFVDSDRRLIMETRLMQDLRSASDLITRDVRRGGYWSNAASSVWTVGTTAPTLRNPYALVRTNTCASTAAAASMPAGGATSAACYWMDRDGNDTSGNDERYGFQVIDGALWAMLAGQAVTQLTDPSAVTVTDLRFDWSGTQRIPATSFCAKTCTSNCPEIVVREVEITIRGHVPGEPTVARQLRSNVRLRNDWFGGQCPT